MTDLRRTVKCSNCGHESALHVSSELDVKELLFAAKCSNCGSSLQINYNIVGSEGKCLSKSTIPENSEKKITLDDDLLSQDIPSDALKDLMGD